MVRERKAVIDRRERTRRWNVAISEGRIVRLNGGKTFKEYRTADAARAVVKALYEDLESGELDASDVYEWIQAQQAIRRDRDE